MYGIINGHLAEMDFENYDGGYVPKDKTYPLGQLENEASRLLPQVRGKLDYGVKIRLLDKNGRELVDCDLAVRDLSEQTLENLRDLLYSRMNSGEETHLSYLVNDGLPNQFRNALMAVPMWTMEPGKSYLTWNIRSLHIKTAEEIAAFTRAMNRHSMVKF